MTILKKFLSRKKYLFLFMGILTLIGTFVGLYLSFKNIDILNAEVFCEQMNNIGFKTYSIIHREIPSKMLPSTRDSITGRFANVSLGDKLVYPTEYILIMERL